MNFWNQGSMRCIWPRLYQLHLEHVTACANAGKHILCEKPLGLTVEEAEEMIYACQEKGVFLGTGLMMRFHGST